MDVNTAHHRPRRRAIGGYMVLSPSKAARYKAVLTFEDGHTSEHPFHSLQEGEAFLRRENSMTWPPEPPPTAPVEPPQ